VRHVLPGEVLLDELELHAAAPHLAIDTRIGEATLPHAEGALVEHHLVGHIAGVHDHDTKLCHAIS